VANDDINIEVGPAEVHAIVGENGAGKSTLMKILYGMQRPDSGAILVNGREIHFRSPKDAIAASIGMVHQHFMLAENLTVLEKRGPGVRNPPTVRSSMHAEARAADPGAVEDLRDAPRSGPPVWRTSRR
jgi:ABC-type uncharacterized transport system ATPase subunit